MVPANSYVYFLWTLLYGRHFVRSGALPLSSLFLKLKVYWISANLILAIFFRQFSVLLNFVAGKKYVFRFLTFRYVYSMFSRIREYQAMQNQVDKMFNTPLYAKSEKEFDRDVLGPRCSLIYMENS